MATGHLASALLATALGVPTLFVAVFTSGWERLELAVLLLPLWLIFGLVWFVALVVAMIDRRQVIWRRWLATPVIVVLVFGASAGAVVAQRMLVRPSVMLTVEARTEGDVLLVSGQTDLPDGARIHVAAWHDELLPLGVYSTATVADGRYGAQVELERWPRGSVHVFVSFGVDERQPPSVIERFGRNGERLQGPAVHEDSDGFRTLQGSNTVFLSEGLPPEHPDALREPAVVFGTVSDEAGVLLEHAVVECGSSPSDAFAFETPWAGPFYECLLQPGSHRITARAPGYVPKSVEVEVGERTEIEVTFVLDADR